MNIDTLRISFLGHKKELEFAKTCFAKELSEGRLVLFNLSGVSGRDRHRVHSTYFSDVAIYEYVWNTGKRGYDRMWEKGMRKRVLKLIENKFAKTVVVVFGQEYGRLLVFIVKEGDQEEIRSSVPGVRFYDKEGKEVPDKDALHNLKFGKFDTMRDYKLMLESI